MTINDHIANFLRDAQYRVAMLGIEMDDIDDEGNYDYIELRRQVMELELFMSILYIGMWKIQDGYNHLGIGSTWTEQEILREIERLRYRCSMNEAPFITFTGHYPKIVQQIIGGSGSGESSGGSGFTPPAGLIYQFLMYNISGILVPVYLDEYGGQVDGETIDQYFENRP